MVGVSIVIPTYERPDMVAPLLMALDSQRKSNEMEAIIVDDSPKDDAKFMISDIANECKYKIQYIESKKRQGLPAARNMGLKYASGKIVGFIDDDSIPLTDAWTEIPSYWLGNGKYVAVGGPVYLRSTQPKGNGDSQIGVINKIIPDIIGNWNHKPKTPILVDTLSGTNMFFKKEILDNIGGFDSRFNGNYYREETDVCMRLSEYGKIVYDPRLAVNHQKSMEGGCRVTPERWYEHRVGNTFLLIAKNWPRALKPFALFTYTSSKIIEACRGKEDRRYYHIPAKDLYCSIFKGIWKGFKKTIKRRN